MFTFICKSVVPTLGALKCLGKLVKNYSCISNSSGTSVALKFCDSYRVIKSYFWLKYRRIFLRNQSSPVGDMAGQIVYFNYINSSITSGSRVIEGSH